MLGRYSAFMADGLSALYQDLLTASPACHLSRALVRADLYYNWRCANRGSNPKDLFDDTYDVLNAIRNQGAGPCRICWAAPNCKDQGGYL